MSMNNRDTILPDTAEAFAELDAVLDRMFPPDLFTFGRLARVLGVIPQAHIERLVWEDPPKTALIRVEDGPVLWCRCCQRGS